jgi:hypothetical protein
MTKTDKTTLYLGIYYLSSSFLSDTTNFDSCYDVHRLAYISIDINIERKKNRIFNFKMSHLLIVVLVI